MIRKILSSTIYRTAVLNRVWSGTSPAKFTEEFLESILKTNFPKAIHIKVEDVSGGCGAMYDISVESVEFQGLSRVKQHQKITEILKTEIKEMHGIRILTTIPKEIN